MGDVMAHRATGGFGTGRIVALVGGAIVIVGAFLDWLSAGPSKGTDVGYAVFWDTNPEDGPNFFASATLVVLVIGVMALLGALPGARAAGGIGGVLAIAAAVLFTITLYRADLTIGELGIGMWLIFAGGVIALVGSLLPAGGGAARPAPPAETPAAPPES